MEEEKKFQQKRKEYLTAQEKSLLEEKKKSKEIVNIFKLEKDSHNLQKEKMLNDIELVRQNWVMIGARNSILNQKLNELLKSFLI
jgi:uncharacterized protein (DUF2344 family)